jgi:predicted O-methyltransferase YrrM
MKCYELADHFSENRERLLDVEWLTSFLEPHCHLLPEGIIGSNLRLLQRPREFAEFLIFMASKSIGSYLEIGLSSGGSFYMADSYLRVVNPDFRRSVGYDKSRGALRDWNSYLIRFPKTIFRQGDSAFINLGSESYDLAFIDACHAESAVLRDFEKVRHNCNYIAFHDIVFKNATVDRAWQKVKKQFNNYWEFIDRTSMMPFGIGVVLLKGSDIPQNFRTAPE